MKSPFQYGTLVDKESFVNRVEERKQLKELLGSGINVMLISPRRWGKSSLVKVAMDEQTHPCMLYRCIQHQDRSRILSRICPRSHHMCSLYTREAAGRYKALPKNHLSQHYPEK